MRPLVDPKEDADLLEKESELYEIILYNDHVNTFDHVINCLIVFVSMIWNKPNNAPGLPILRADAVLK